MTHHVSNRVIVAIRRNLDLAHDVTLDQSGIQIVQIYASHENIIFGKRCICDKLINMDSFKKHPFHIGKPNADKLVINLDVFI